MSTWVEFVFFVAALALIALGRTTATSRPNVNPPPTFPKPDPPPGPPPRERDRRGRCRTCAHWDPDALQLVTTLVGAGHCAMTPEIWTVADEVDEAALEHPVYLLRPEHAAVLAVVQDGSGYSARLVTRPDFGCVQHKARA